MADEIQLFEIRGDRKTTSSELRTWNYDSATGWASRFVVVLKSIGGTKKISRQTPSAEDRYGRKGQGFDCIGGHRRETEVFKCGVGWSITRFSERTSAALIKVRDNI